MANVLRLLRAGAAAPLLCTALVAGACAEDPTASSPDREAADGPDACRLDPAFLFDSGVRRDGIPALSQPTLLTADHPEIQRFLRPEDRVLGLLVAGAAYAIPHNVLWYHEIANVSLPTDRSTLDIAATYCPLTGSALVFDRAHVAGAEFGVSGLLYKSNLIMYDRRMETSLWPQMLSEARCGPASGTALERVAAIEMTWQGWRSLHPDTHVLGGAHADGPYDRYPYGDYEQDEGFDFPMPYIDPLRPPKERVLGVKTTDADAVAFPFGNLDAKGAWAAVPFTLGAEGRQAVVLWDKARRSAMAYWRDLGGDTLTFTGLDEGIADAETGSLWTVEGLAVAGPLTGHRLEPVRQSFVAFWGAWYAFFPQTDIWGPAKPRP